MSDDKLKAAIDELAADDRRDRAYALMTANTTLMTAAIVVMHARLPREFFMRLCEEAWNHTAEAAKAVLAP